MAMTTTAKTQEASSSPPPTIPTEILPDSTQQPLIAAINSVPKASNSSPHRRNQHVKRRPSRPTPRPIHPHSLQLPTRRWSASKDDIEKNRTMLTHFFEQSKHLLVQPKRRKNFIKEGGQVLVALRSTSFYQQFKIVELAESVGMKLVTKEPFEVERWSALGYIPQRTTPAVRTAPTMDGAELYVFVIDPDVEFVPVLPEPVSREVFEMKKEERRMNKDVKELTEPSVKKPKQTAGEAKKPKLTVGEPKKETRKERALKAKMNSGRVQKRKRWGLKKGGWAGKKGFVSKSSFYC
ncbi:hypothetical protein BC829DRAFT_143065 [Chytridium lagenaria]|nr:hypothetical protein BC829DRAFT_143065 [Chytridium lagenaria]